jgi:1,4-alpha-glucan branching enzyme
MAYSSVYTEMQNNRRIMSDSKAVTSAYRNPLVPFPLSAYIPFLFMGEEYGESAPFRYFVSQGDPSFIEAVRLGREEEFARFHWRRNIPDS